MAENNIASITIPVNGRRDRVITVYDVATNDLPGSLNTTRFPKFLPGKVSKSSNQNNTTWYSYDEFSRLKWTVQQSLGGVPQVIDYRYNLIGNIMEITYDVGTVNEFHQHYVYDGVNRLIKVYTSNDGINKTIEELLPFLKNRDWQFFRCTSTSNLELPILPILDGMLMH